MSTPTTPAHPTFSYTGFDTSGAKVHGTIEAADKNEAIESLRRRGVFVSELCESAGSPPLRAGPQATHQRPGSERRAASARLAALLSGLRRGQRLEQVASFTRQLSLLVSTGTPLVEALASLEQQTDGGPFREVLTALRSRVEEGAQLSEAMASSDAHPHPHPHPHPHHHPLYFDAVCISLIRAGEQGGKLEVMLQRLATLIRQQVKIRKTVKGAMVYPALLIVVAIVVVTAMLGFVLPRFEGLFKSLDTPLPATTKLLMSASALLRGYWWAFLSGQK